MISYVCDNADMAFLLSKKMPADRICKGHTVNKDTVKGKNILITGATSGIGKTIARQFAGEGARVVLVGRRQEILQKLKEELGRKYHNSSL